MWSIQNITRVALMQVGVVIASIFVGALYHKWSSMSDPPGPMPPYQIWWYQHGIFGFGLPICWVVVSLYLYSQGEVADSTKLLTFWLGVFTVVILAMLVVNSVLHLFMPDFHIM
jgi:hypothetical protein